MGSPEYPEDQNEFKPPSTNSLPMHGFEESSDSEDESANERTVSIDPYAGYQQLNLEDLPDIDDNDDEADDSTNAQETTPNQNPTADTEIVCQVWNAPRPNELDINMDSKKSEEIKSLMSKVTLGNIEPPEWARHIPETKWIAELLQDLRHNAAINEESLDQITPGPNSGSSSSQ